MKFRMLALLTILAVMFTAVPAFAGHPHHPPRHKMPRHGWTVPRHLPPPPVRRYYRPPVYVGPRVLPGYVVPSPGYWVPGRYYYEPGLEIGIARGGIGLHIGF